MKKILIDAILVFIIIICICIFVYFGIIDENYQANNQLFVTESASLEKLDESDDYEANLFKVLYNSSSIDKQTFENFFVKNKGENIKFSAWSIGYGMATKDEQKNRTTYEYPAFKYYPDIRVDSVDVLNNYKDEILENGKKCIKIKMVISNDSEKDCIYTKYYYDVGLMDDNFLLYELSDSKLHYTEYIDGEKYYYYETILDDKKNIIGVFNTDTIGSNIMIKAHNKIEFYEYYVVTEEAIESGKLALGDTGLIRERSKGNVEYSNKAFRIILFPENQEREGGFE